MDTTFQTIAHFEAEFGSYQYFKGAVRFSLNQELPFALVERITQYRAECRRGLKKKAK